MVIAKVSIKSFRGIPNELTFDLTAGTNQLPHSLILFGDNGTGKSSIVDAIQFALQAQIGYKRNIRNVLSLAVESMPTVSAYLTTGEIIQRFIEKDYIQKKEKVLELFNLNDEQRVEQFKIAPLVLRRADILRFLETPDERRQIVFLDYRFRQKNFDENDSLPVIRDIEPLEKQRLENKKRRRVLVEKLAKRIAVDPNSIPLSLKEFDQFIREKVYGGLSARERYSSRKDGISSVSPQIHETIEEIRKLNEQIPKIGQELKTSRKAESKAASDLVLKELLLDTGNRLTEAFHQISNCNFVDKIEIACGDIIVVSLSLKIHLKNGQVCLPHKLFSEANLDLLVLLFFLSLAKEAASRGQAKLLILDDVLQSVDATIRVAIANYILKEFTDWQLIFTVHDRLWQNQLRDIFRRTNHTFIEREIIRWNFSEGPVILEGMRDMDSLLMHCIEQGELYGICSKAGLLLEEICGTLSWTLPISVTRRKEDKYTLGDLWPGVLKVLKKTNLKEVAHRVDAWLHLRNLIGAHYNEWARAISNQEAQSFGEAVVELFHGVKCRTCSRWIEDVSGKGKKWSCRCGVTTLE